jgi:hypothetical protein
MTDILLNLTVDEIVIQGQINLSFRAGKREGYPVPKHRQTRREASQAKPRCLV